MSLMKVARKTVCIALCCAILFGTNGGASANYNFIQNGNFSSFTAYSGSGNSTTSPTQGQLGAWINATGWSTSNDTGGNVATNLVYAANTSSTSESGSRNVTGDPTQYYLYGNSPGYAGIVSPTGGGFLAMDGDSQYRGAVSQTLSGLTVGTTYNLVFDWAGAQQTGNSSSGPMHDYIKVTFGSDTQQTQTISNQNQSFSGWYNSSMAFTATSTIETLSFLAISDQSVPPYLLMTDIAFAVPEPSSIALVASGLLALLGIGVRRRMARTAKA